MKLIIKPFFVCLVLKATTHAFCQPKKAGKAYEECLAALNYKNYYVATYPVFSENRVGCTGRDHQSFREK